ncbi:MAG: MoaD/ThiS family protein [Bacteroidota bacterium]
MKVNVLFFGILSEVTGKNTLELDDIENLRALKSYLWKTFPGLKEMDYRFAVNKEVVDGKVEFKNGDDVALLPPFAGG